MEPGSDECSLFVENVLREAGAVKAAGWRGAAHFVRRAHVLERLVQQAVC